MILIDTSVWIRHFAYGESALVDTLDANAALVHDFVIGELACGNLRQRGEKLNLLRRLPRARVASTEETLQLIDARRLMGRGIGYVDVHLLASALLEGAPLWTFDLRLHATALGLGIARAAGTTNG